MKQSTVKALGAAALGAAFAAVSAGTAQAAVAPSTHTALDTVTRNLPAAQSALANTLNPAVQTAKTATTPTADRQPLVGGLPARAVDNTKLPASALVNSAVPLGL